MDWAALLQSYRVFEPSGVVALHRSIPAWMGLGFGAMGLCCLLFGNGALFRLIAGPLAGLAGAVWLPVVLSRVGLPAGTPGFALSAGGALFVLGLLAPPFALFFFIGLPAGLLAGSFVGSTDFLLGFTPAFVVLGTLAAMFHGALAAVASSILGGWLLTLGTLAVATRAWPGLGESAATHAWAVLLVMAFLATAGALYQMVLRRTPEEVRSRRLERARERKRLEEKQALERRWMGDGSPETKPRRRGR